MICFSFCLICFAAQGAAKLKCGLTGKFCFIPLRARILSSQKLCHGSFRIIRKKCYFLTLVFLFIFILIIVILRRKNRIKTVYYYYINKKTYPYKGTKTGRHSILKQLCLNIRIEIVKSLSVLNSVMVLKQKYLEEKS